MGLYCFSENKCLKEKKVGHAGTLDPNAEGILPVAVNKATKLIPFISSNSKQYNFKIKWGEQTSTDDTEGNIINYSNKIPDSDEIKKVIKFFLGFTNQVPPKASAVKVNGKRAYAILREKENLQNYHQKLQKNTN